MKTRLFIFSTLSVALLSFVLVSCHQNSGKLQFLGSTTYSKVTNSKVSLSDEEASFKEFLKGFPKKRGNFRVTAEELKKFAYNKENAKKNEKKVIDKKFSNILPSLLDYEFSRMPMDGDHYYYAQLKTDKNYIAVLYMGSYTVSAYDDFGGDQVSCSLVTFSPEGELIDQHYSLAYVGGMNSYAGFEVTKDLKFIVNTYQYKYQKDVNEYGYKDNVVTGTEMTSTQTFYIADNGEIEKESKVKENKASQTKKSSSI